MIVKLVNTRGGSTHSAYFDIPREVHTWPVNVHHDSLTAANERRFIHWSDKDGELREEVLALAFQVLGPDGQYETVFSNWTAYLMNDEGKTIERVFP